MSELPEDVDGQAIIDEALARLLDFAQSVVKAMQRYEDTLNAIAVLHNADVGRMGLAICAECSQEGEPVFWPCDTVRLIAELVEADDE